MKKCLILANGDTPKKSVVKFLQRNGYDFLICADGGADSAKKLNLVPGIIVGDLDSVSDETLKFYRKNCEIKKITRQNDTDVEKAIKLAVKLKYDEAILLGATGDRLDHSFCNLGIAIKFHDKIDISILHEKSFLKVHRGKVEIKTTPGETVSIYGIDNKTKITTRGLKYPLKNESLPFGIKESTSNIAKREKVELQIKGGYVFVIREFNVLKSNGYFR